MTVSLLRDVHEVSLPMDATGVRVGRGWQGFQRYPRGQGFRSVSRTVVVVSGYPSRSVPCRRHFVPVPWGLRHLFESLIRKD